MKKLALFISDILILYLALVLTILVRYRGEFALKFSGHLLPFSIIFILWLIVFYVSSLYDIPTLRNNPRFYSLLFQSIAISATLSVIFFYLLPLYGLTPKTNLLLFAVIFASIETLSRYTSNKLLEKHFKKLTIIVGQNPQALELAQFIKENPQLGYTLKHIIDVTPASDTTPEHSAKKFGTIESIENIKKIIKDDAIDTVIVSSEVYQRPEIIDAFYQSLKYKVVFRNLISFYEQLTGRVSLKAISQTWFLDNLQTGSQRTYEIAKRAVDIVSSVMLGILTLPFYPLVFLMLMFDEGRGIWSIQERVGQGGKLIRLFKFRTMLISDDRGNWDSATKNNVTHIGAFLRKTRLDEMPQLWNVLLGSLSLIGPRPEFPRAVETYKKFIPYYDIRHLIKPGLSGWAQINHDLHPHHGVDVDQTHTKLSYDLYYIKNRSLIMDLGIGLKTLSVILRLAGR